MLCQRLVGAYQRLVGDNSTSAYPNNPSKIEDYLDKASFKKPVDFVDQLVVGMIPLNSLRTRSQAVILSRNLTTGVSAFELYNYLNC